MRSFGVITQSGSLVRKDLMNQYALKEESRQIREDRFSNQYSEKGLIEPLYNPEALTRLLEINTYHYRACRTKARDTAGLGWKLVSVGDDAPVSEHDRIHAILDDQSPPLTMTLDQCQLDYEAVGWAALEIVPKDYRHDGEILALNHVPAHTVRIHQDGTKYAQKRGKNIRWFRKAGVEADIDFATGAEHDVNTLPIDRRASELIVWVNYTPRSDYYGVPDVLPALGAIHGDLSRRDFNIAFFDNFGVPAYAVFITGDYEDEDILDAQGDPTGETELQQSIEEHFSELNKNPHSTLVMSVPSRSGGEGEVKIHFEKLATDVKEASFRLFRQDNRDEILSAHGVDPYRAGIAESGSLGGNTAVQQTEIYKRSVIEPRQQTIEALFNRHIIHRFTERWSWKLDEIDTQDESHELDILTGLHNIGAVTRTEIRDQFIERFGLNPDVDLTSGEADFAAVGVPALINGAIITPNEGRQMLGLPPIDGGDELRPVADVEELEAAVFSLQDKLTKVVLKEQGAARANGHRVGSVDRV